MTAEKPANYTEDIHLEDYTAQYAHPLITAEDMVFDRGRPLESLAGEWHYAVDVYDSCLRQKWYLEQERDALGFTLPRDYSFDEWPTMVLPANWNTVEREFLLYEGSMVFTRRFSYRSQGEAHVLLRIGAANYVCRVFLNGRYIGMHRGGSTPAYFELTEALQPENRLLITVDDTRREEQVPTVQTDWFNYGGLYREISLIRLPETYLRRFQLSLLPDGSYRRLRLKAALNLPLDTEACLEIPELGICASFPVRNGLCEATLAADPQLWSPEHPKLYDVSLSVPGDRVTDRVGFREIRVCGRELLLNGKPLFLRGISCHEDSLTTGKALTDAERRQILLLAKELGCNFMRLSHYPHHENMSRLADELGLLLWEEIPVYWAIQFGRDDTYADASNQLTELITRDFNRASVILWSVGNENADTEARLNFMSRLALLAHHLDDTRLVSAACLVNSAENRIADRLIPYLDVIGLNEYYGWYVPDFSKLPQFFANSRPDKPVIVTEFGADALPGHHGTVTDKGTEECQAQVYRDQLAVLPTIPFVKGMTPWILYDFRCPRRTSALQKYYNRKGLCAPDRQYRKQAFFILQDFYRKMALMRQDTTGEGTEPI